MENGQEVKDYGRFGLLNGSYDPVISTNAVALGGDILDGRIGLLRVYDRALPESEISEHYEQTRGMFGVKFLIGR